MPFDPSEFEGYQEIEAGSQPDFEPLPRGLYHFSISAESSEVTEVNGLPRLRLSLSVLEGDMKGRTHSEFLGWFASETSESPKTYEEREGITRGISRTQFLRLIDALADSPYTTPETGRSIVSAVHSLDKTDDHATVKEIMEAIPQILDAVDFYARITPQTKDPTRVNLKPVKYGVGQGELEPVGSMAV